MIILRRLKIRVNAWCKTPFKKWDSCNGAKSFYQQSICSSKSTSLGSNLPENDVSENAHLILEQVLAHQSMRVIENGVRGKWKKLKKIKAHESVGNPFKLYWLMFWADQSQSWSWGWRLVCLSKLWNYDFWVFQVKSFSFKFPFCEESSWY